MPPDEDSKAIQLYFEDSMWSEVPTSLLYSEQTVVVSLLQQETIQKAIQGTYIPKMYYTTK